VKSLFFDREDDVQPARVMCIDPVANRTYHDWHVFVPGGCQYVPRVIVTDHLKSHSAAKREMLPGVEHRQHRYLNNGAENSHQPTRQRERRRQGFKSPGHAQRFLSVWSHCTVLPPTASSIVGLGLPARDAATIPDLAGTYEPTHRSIRGEIGGKPHPFSPTDLTDRQ
jgi:hypothetical protein